MNDTEAIIFLCQCLGSSNEPEQDRKGLIAEIESGKVHWEPVLKVASENRFYMSIALFRALEDKKLLDLLPEGLHEYLLEIRDLNSARNERLKKQIIEISKILNEVGIEPILIKGAANTMAGLYPDPATRVMEDVDILVTEEESLKALNALQKAGYRRTQKCLDAGDFQDLPESHLECPGQLGIVDLHRDLNDTQGYYILNNNDIVKTSILLEVEGARMRVPSATECIKIQVCHSYSSSIHHLLVNDTQLRDLFDCYLLTSQNKYKIDWNEIVKCFSNCRHRNYLQNYFLLIERLFGKTSPIKKTSHPFFWLHLKRTFIPLRFPIIKTIDRTFFSFVRTIFRLLSSGKSGQLQRKNIFSMKWYKAQFKKVMFGLRNPNVPYNNFPSSD
jgi:hypothetical protein